LAAGKNTLGHGWKLAIASSLKRAKSERLQALRAMLDVELTRNSLLGLSMVACVRGAMSDIVEAQDIDGQLYVSAHNLPEFLERAMERGAEIERARIVAWLRKNAKLNPQRPEAQALVILFSNAIEDGEHQEEQEK
jgi:hypothetical protein